MRDKCIEHSGHEARLNSLETNKEEMWKSIDRSHSRIDGMKNWVIAGMTSLVIQLVLFIGGLIMLYVRTGK